MEGWEEQKEANIWRSVESQQRDQNPLPNGRN